MHITYRATRENDRRATQKYTKSYPNRRKLFHQMFVRVHPQLCEFESVTSTCHDRGGTDRHEQF